MNQTDLPANSAKEIDALAANWLQRRRFWDWSTEDQAKLDAWLAESLAHRAAYLRLSDIWNRTGRLVALRPRPVVRPALRFRSVFAHVAAGVAVVAVLATAVMWFRPEAPKQSYTTSIGGRETIVLVDGSRIELNTDTVLRVAKTGRERTVWLDKGEAYFQIRHDAARPFVVWADGHRITDLGTKFVVRREPDHLEVSLMEGRARLEGPADQDAILVPGDVAVATAKSMSVSKKPEQLLSADLGWRRGVLTFNRTTLADAVAEFNRYNHTRLAVADAATGKRRIYGTFPTTDVEAVTRVVQAVFGLKVALRDGETVISQ
jgi:transmembrane sensor